jgi:GNAT superfamily N-acetyltransferase
VAGAHLVRRRHIACTGVYGVPEQWPHIRELYARAGFPLQGRTEIVYLASVADLGSADTDGGLVARRTLGINGTRFSALLGEVVGFIEVDTNLEEGARLSRLRGWADVGNLEVAEAHRRQGIGSWLLQQAAGWLQLGGVERLLAYAVPDERELIAFLEQNRFRELTRTIRGLQQPARSLSFD